MMFLVRMLCVTASVLVWWPRGSNCIGNGGLEGTESVPTKLKGPEGSSLLLVLPSQDLRYTKPQPGRPDGAGGTTISTSIHDRGTAGRQFWGLNNNRELPSRPGNNQMSGGDLNNHIIGSSPEGVVSMVQSFVEDMTRRPAGTRPGYVMVNSRNPVLIQQLVTALTQRYGSTSVIQDPGTIQNIVSIQDPQSNNNEPSQDTGSDMPVFPLTTTWNHTHNSIESRDPEVEYIRQQLAAIAHISVSSGRLVNDTTPDPLNTTTPTPTLALNLTADTTTAAQTHQDDQAGNITTSPDEQHSGMQSINETKASILLSSSQDHQGINQHISSGSSFTHEQIKLQDVNNDGPSTLNETEEQRVEDVEKFEHLQGEEIIENNWKLNENKTAINNNVRQSGVYINNIFYSEVMPEDDSGNIIVDTTGTKQSYTPNTGETRSPSSIISDTNIANPPSSTLGFNNSVLETDLNINEILTQESTLNNAAFASEVPKVTNVPEEDPAERDAMREVSTTGYEDYYEEIDGEMVLSPTKFMRKGGPIVPDDYPSYHDYSQTDGEDSVSDDQLNKTQHNTGLGNDIRPIGMKHNSLNQVKHWTLSAIPSASKVNNFPDSFNLPSTSVDEDVGMVGQGSIINPYINPVLYEQHFGELNSPVTPVYHQLHPVFDVSPSTGGTGSHEQLNFEEGVNSGYYGSVYEGPNVTIQLNQHVDNDKTKSGIYHLHPNSDNILTSLHTSHPTDAVLAGHVKHVSHTGGGGMAPMDPQLLENLWNISDKDLSKMALLQELDRIPVVYDGDEELIADAPSLEALPTDVLNQLAGMNNGELETLGLLDQMKTMTGRSSSSRDSSVSPLSEDVSEKDSKNQRLQQLTNTSVTPHSIEESTASYSSSPGEVAKGDLRVPVRINFTAGNYRQSDLSINDHPTQHLPPNFFPTRPTQSLHQGSSHHGEGGNGAHLTREQQEIIARLPVGMRPVVSSIVLAVQAPSSLTTTTTTTGPQHYPLLYPYAYPYPPYPYYPPPSFPHPPLTPQTHPATTTVPHNHDSHHPHHTPATFGHSTHDGNGAHGGHGVHRGQGAQDGHGAHNSHGAHGSHDNHSELGSQNNRTTQIAHTTSANHISNDPDEDHHLGTYGHAHLESQGGHGVPGSSHDDNGGEDNAVWRSDNTPRPVVVTPSASPRISGVAPARGVPGRVPLPGGAVSVTQGSVVSTLNPVIGLSRLGEFDNSGLEDVVETSIRDNNNKPSGVNRIGPSRPDRNQGLLQLRQEPFQMGHGRPSGGGFVNYRPPQQTNMQMGTPVVNVVMPEATRPDPTPAEEEPGPLIEPGVTQEDAAVTRAPQTMDREEANSLLQSLFSSPTLLLLGIVFATSAAYMAIAMEEQAAQQRFQQAQLAAAFGGQPFLPGRRRRSLDTLPWYPTVPPILKVSQ
ncbi:uncharacterized protein LOC121856449 isoform X2 [Homarus americanus]|uniref:Expansin-A24-like n=1 Tax=Homarus americanus TaxID=6706 RepID=A0A8J5J7S1_HOMAM|nr:uncharacterized protein LOC121856449 isoform X1 [Homarus americanus]XP_042207980.1 uncharacterized protein LOC121856449 isoform X2 [Homarus americanus]KAG7154287.1 Expansin-A24-like [Homarus americanus]